VSKIAPAADLVTQLDGYIEDLEESVEDEAEYNDSKDKLVKDASTLALIAVALGLHDEENKYRRAAPGLLEAAKKVAAAETYAQAKAAVAALKAALASQGDPSTLSWANKNASMPALMKAVPLVNTRIKRYMRRFSRYANRVASYSAVLAVIGQGSMPNASDTEKPNEVDKWYAFCAEMRDAAAALNVACHAEDEAAAEKAMAALQKSCDACHEVFHEEEL